MPGGVAREMRAGNDPALVLTRVRSENRVRVKLAQAKSLADVARTFGLASPSGLYYCEGERTRLMDAHELIARCEAGERDFSWANLYQADLSGAVLPRAVLYHVNLSGANLKGANLDSADLIGANLREANLREANLSGAKLREADLGMADLAWANVTDEQLDTAASLKGATMPDGTKHE